MDNIPSGFEAGKDYVSVVSADNYGWLEFDDRYQERAMAAKGKAEKTVLVILGMSASAKSSGPGHEEPPTAVGFLSKTQ
jgi:hypothetical protein